MAKIEFTKPYKFAHHGIHVEEFVAGQVVDASDELSDCALADKVAKQVKAKADREAPENRAESSAPETK